MWSVLCRGDAARGVLVPELRPLLGGHGAVGARLPLAAAAGAGHGAGAGALHVLLHHLDCVRVSATVLLSYVIIISKKNALDINILSGFYGPLLNHHDSYHKSQRFGLLLYLYLLDRFLVTVKVSTRNFQCVTNYEYC